MRNGRLKKLVAELTFDRATLQDVAADLGTWSGPKRGLGQKGDFT